MLNVSGSLLYEFRCMPGRSSRAHCKISHLFGNHGESGAGLSGPGSLDRGIQGQKVGLKSNAFNGTGDIRNFFTGL